MQNLNEKKKLLQNATAGINKETRIMGGEFKGQIIVKLKDSIKDVRGLTLEEAVKSSFNESFKFRTGTVYDFSLLAETKEEAQKKVNKIIEELLCNPITEVSEVIWEK